MNIVLHKFATFSFILFIFKILEYEAVDPNSETVKYEPLYVVDKGHRYTVVNLMTFDENTQKYMLATPPEYNIELACPKENQDDENGAILQVVDLDVPATRKIPLGQICEHPVKPFVKKFPDTDHYSVGFLMYKEDSSYNAVNLNEDLPEHTNLITLMVVNFDRSDSRPVSVWHTIDFGEWIEIEPGEPSNNTEYEKNHDIYGFDVDKAYSLDHQEWIFALQFAESLPCPLIKMQLAPAEDFLLQNYKAMSRMNLNTAPIWERLLPQWRSLEKFVRKVARVLGRLTIITGTFETLPWPHATRGYEPQIKLYDKFTVPKFIWKAVVSRYGDSEDATTNYGILFIMYNHPYSALPYVEDAPPLCNDIIAETGWHLHSRQSGTGRGGVRSQIYACVLTQHNMNLVEGGTIPISAYKAFNLYDNVTRPHYDDNFEEKSIEHVNVLRQLCDRGLLPKQDCETIYEKFNK